MTAPSPSAASRGYADADAGVAPASQTARNDTSNDTPEERAQRDAVAARALSLDVSRFVDRTSRFALIAIAVMGLGIILHLGQYVFAPVLAGILVGFTFGPLSDRLERFGVSAATSAVAIVLATIAAFALILWALAVPIDTWSSRLPEITNRLEQHWQEFRGPIDRLKQVERQVSDISDDDATRPTEVTVRQQGIISNVITSAADIVARIIVFIGVFYFFLATRRQIKRAAVRSSPTLATRLRVARITRDTEAYLSRYVATISVINVGLGVVVAAAMYLIGLPQPLLWGALAAGLNYALFVGPAVMTIILLGVGLTTYPDPVWALAPPVIYVVLNVLEGQFITPTVLGDRLTLNPLLVFVTISFWLWLWGPIGAFLSVPILIIVTMIIYHIVPNAGTAPRLRRRRRPM